MSYDGKEEKEKMREDKGKGEEREGERIENRKTSVIWLILSRHYFSQMQLGE